MKKRLEATLKELNITHFEFAIGTHSHSDHVGNYSWLFDKVKVDKFYLKDYQDKYILGTWDRWDNQFSHDRAKADALKNHVKLIENITDKDAKITLGDMKIQLYNYKNTDKDGKRIYYDQENSESILSVIKVNGHKIYLGGDATTSVEKIYGPQIGKVDFMKADHHNSFRGNNDPEFIKTLQPKYFLETGGFVLTSWAEKYFQSIGTKFYSSNKFDRPFLAFDFGGKEIKEVSDSYPHKGFTKDKEGRTYYENWDGTRPSKGLFGDGVYYYYSSGNGYIVKDTLTPDCYRLDKDDHWNNKEVTLTKVGSHYQLCKIGGKKFYNQWVSDRDNWYLTDGNGYARFGWYQDGNSWYYLGSDGIMYTGWHKIGQLDYYFRVEADGDTGNLIRGWAYNPDAKAWHYFTHAGYPYYGWLREGSTWYYLNGYGVMATGWVKSGGYWYYMNGSGAMATGWAQDGKTWYYLSGSGAMVTGWKHYGSRWFYMNGSGAMTTGWQKVGGTWYYLSDWGAMATGWAHVDGTWYYLSGSGAMQTGWIKTGGKWYYLNGSGAMVTGKNTIGGKTYTFDKDGVWVS